MAKSKDEGEQLDLVSLESMAQGAPIEMFQEELAKCILNIKDPNTEAEKARTITLNVKLLPDASRKFTNVEIQATSKLAPNRAVGTGFYIGLVAGQPVAKEYDDRQMQIDNVTSIKEGTTDKVITSRLG